MEMAAGLPQPAARTVHRPHRLADRVFFSLMALVILASVVIGFAKTYYLAGMVAAPLPSRIIHIHGAVFSLWIVLLIVQTALVSAKQIRIHRKLGLAGFGLACLMVVMGLLAAVDSLRRGVPIGGMTAETFLIVPVTDMIAFSILVWASYRARFKPDAHKRLILIATIALMGAAIGRWNIAILHTKPATQDLAMLALLVVVACYDLILLRRIHRSTVWASALVIVIHVVRFPIAATHAWQTFASHVAGRA